MNTAKNTHTIGIDLGDKSHETCTLNCEGEIIERSTVLNNRAELIRFSKANRGATLIMEAGCHSPWISRLLSERGHKIVVANPRKVRAIYETDNKNDERDAELLARIGRFDRNLLYGIDHKSEAHQRTLKIIEARDVLVATRVKLVNHVRGSLKSLGIFLPAGCSTDSFARRATEYLEEADYALLAPVIESISNLTERIKAEDKRIGQMITDDYPAARKLLTIPGVGPITALSFVLIIGSPDRFETARDVGPFLGLVPARDQSGDSDKPMRITKAGNHMMRRLLVSCAQYTLGHFGPPSAIKEAGERKAKTGAKIAKKKAVVMTARKLAVMMLALWKDPDAQYEPFPQKRAAKEEAIAA